MIEIHGNAGCGVTVVSKLMLDCTTAKEFEEHPNHVMQLAKDANIIHFVENTCEGRMSVVTFEEHRTIPFEELEEFGKRHEAWLKDVKGSIEKYESENHEPIDFTDEKRNEKPNDEDIRFLNQMKEVVKDDEIIVTAIINASSAGNPFLDIPIAKIGRRLLRILIKDAIEKYVS